MKGDNNFRLLEDEEGQKRKGSRSYSFYSDPGVPLDEVVLNEASFLSSYMNLTNTIIGSGMSPTFFFSLILVRSVGFALCSRLLWICAWIDSHLYFLYSWHLLIAYFVTVCEESSSTFFLLFCDRG
jgi:hypothetical protein